MRVLSLFDGISIGHLALDRAKIPVDVYYASEVDKYAIAVTQKNYPNTVQLGDVEKIDFTQFEGEIDLLIGGSPCQNLSVSGNRKGLEGDESRLFWEYVRAIKECKPKYFFLENVASMNDKDKEIISKELGCYPIEINSALLSAQNRRRYYWFNWGNKQYNLFGFPTCDIPQPKDKHILLKDVLESGVGVKLEDYAKRIKKVTNKSNCLAARDYKGFGHQEMTGVFEPIIYQLPHGYNQGGIIRDKAPTMTSSKWEHNNKVVQIGNVGSNAQTQRVYSVRGKSITLNANGGGQGGKTGLYKIDLPDGDYIIRKLTPRECERLQTIPDDWTKYGINGEISNTQRYKMIGNSWTCDVIAYIFGYLKGSEVK